MRLFVIIAGVMHALLPEAHRQMRINESAPTRHPLIDSLDLTAAAKLAAAKPRPTPVTPTAIYVGGQWIERSCV